MKERYVFNQNGKKAYMPQMYGLKNHAENIFSVPGVNNIGTLEFDNGLTLINLSDDHPDYKVAAKDYYDEVFGDYVYSYSPVYSDDVIMYGQANTVYRINIRNGQVKEYDFYGNIIKESGINVSRIVPVGKPNTFLCEILNPWYGREKKDGKLIEFTESAEERGSLPLGFKNTMYDQPWQLSNGFIFSYDSAANKLICNTTELKQGTHPFAEIFNHNNGQFRKLKEFLIHPTLPFGIVVEIGKDWDSEKINAMPTEIYDSAIVPLIKERDRHALYLLRWDTQDTNKQFVPIFTEPASVIPGLHPKTYSDFQWSPDGKWLVFRDETQYTEYEYGMKTAEENPVFIALPVSEKNPLFIGEPLYLGKVMREDATPTSSAWIQKPVSFVVSDGLVLYKWDLDNVDSAMKINSPNDVVKVK